MVTTTQLLELDGIRQRSDAFRFELRDRAGGLLGELHPDSSTAAVVSNDVSRRVPRSLDGLRLNPSDAAEVNVISDRVRAVMTLQNGAEYSLGTFLWGDDSRPRHSWGLTRSSTLIDRTFVLDQEIGRVVSFGRGINVGLAFLAVVLDVITLDEIEAEETDQALAAPVAWPPTATRRQIAADLADKIGFLPPYFNRDDRLVWRSVPEMTTAQPTLAYEAGGRIISGSIVESDNLLTAPNSYLVIESSGAGNPIIGRWDLPSTAPHSIANRGFPVVRTETMQGIADAAQAVAAARALAKRDTSTYEWAEFSSTADPRHDTYDVVAYLGTNYLEVAWRLVCRSGGQMSHKLRRVYS